MTWIRRILLTLSVLTGIFTLLAAWYYFKGFSTSAVRRAQPAAHPSVEGTERDRLDQHSAAL